MKPLSSDVFYNTKIIINAVRHNGRGERRKEKGERRKEKGERREERGERRKEKYRNAG
ncbi:MAG TPA: hypothetical protein P5184_07090 [Bacteroidales bacterium]|nr:hypothetical protein [Bacteroidales bacterium]